MEDPPLDSAPRSEESSAQRQARLRRERREAKIKAGGSTRLDKITQLSGRSADVAPVPSQATQQSTLSSPNDPDEVDISEHTYPTPDPPRNNGAPTEADIRQLLRSAPPNQDAQGDQEGPGQDDPMVQMLQQMMGGIPGAQGEAPQGGLPPGLAAMLGAGGGGANGPLGQRGREDQSHSLDGYLWRIIHALFAFALGIYITALTTFNGAQFSKTDATTISGARDGDGEIGKRLFWIFATAEVVLQSGRYFLEKGTTTQSGWLGMTAQVLPEPWKSYLGLVARYSGIWFTVVEDAMVVIFILGVVAWWKGSVS
ncbi:MAG: hypothetical protein Q9174_000638 [Haloplaca sp. 1 TL-2023]